MSYDATWPSLPSVTPGMSFEPRLRGPIPERNRRFTTSLACGKAPTGSAPRSLMMPSSGMAALAPVLAHARGIQLDADVFRLGEEAQRLLAAFAADTALLHPAKRRAQVAQHPAVDPDDPGLQPRSNPVRAIDVARPEAGGQAVVRAVGHLDRVIFIIERRDCDDRAEDLFEVGAARVRQTGDDGRLEEEPVATPRVWRRRELAAASDLAAFGLGQFDVAEDLVQVRARGDRPLLGRRIDRVADLQL